MFVIFLFKNLLRELLWRRDRLIDPSSPGVPKPLNFGCGFAALYC
jgi:hypothetical protein